MHLVAFGSFVGPDTTWLLRTDAMLGLLTLLCLVVVAVAIVGGMVGRLLGRRRDLIQGIHSTTFTRLGIAMKDDGQEQPDEKIIHPGRIPARKAKGTVHPR